MTHGPLGIGHKRPGADNPEKYDGTDSSDNDDGTGSSGGGTYGGSPLSGNPLLAGSVSSDSDQDTAPGVDDGTDSRSNDSSQTLMSGRNEASSDQTVSENEGVADSDNDGTVEIVSTPDSRTDGTANATQAEAGTYETQDPDPGESAADTSEVAERFQEAESDEAVNAAKGLAETVADRAEENSDRLGAIAAGVAILGAGVSAASALGGD